MRSWKWVRPATPSASRAACFAPWPWRRGAQGVQVDPAQLNLPELYEDNVYQVERIDEVPGLENAVFESYTSFAEDRVREILGRGEACLCRVLRDGNVHWLVITGAQEDAFLALDPARRRPGTAPGGEGLRAGALGGGQGLSPGGQGGTRCQASSSCRM